MAASAPEQAVLPRGYVEPDLVVLDDLFLARRVSEASAELLQTVVHQRYKHRLSIIVTSNRVVQDWGKYLGDATLALNGTSRRADDQRLILPSVRACRSSAMTRYRVAWVLAPSTELPAEFRLPRVDG